MAVDGRHPLHFLGETMNKLIRRGLQVAAFTGGLMIVGTGAAIAADSGDSTSTPGTTSLISIPITVQGNAIGAAGNAAATAKPDQVDGAAGHHRGSLLSLPITINHNSIAIRDRRRRLGSRRQLLRSRGSRFGY